MRSFLHLRPLLPLAGLVLASGCDSPGKRLTPPPAVTQPALPRPTLTGLTPNIATIGAAGTLVLQGSNFASGASLSAPPGLSFKNIRVNSPSQITADFAISADSPLGYFGVKVTTPGGMSDPQILTIVPRAYDFGVIPSRPADGGPPALQSLEVGIHAAQVDNPDGSQTDAYLHVSITDDKGHPAATGPSWHGDMDNVDVPDDDTDESGVTHPDVTTYSFSLQFPAEGKYVMLIKGSRSGSFNLEMDAQSASPQGSLGALQNVPTYPGSSFELNFICRRAPFAVDLDSGGLQPAHGAFSFAQPLTPDVHLPADQKALGVVIYYDPLMETSSFQATLDDADRTGLFHVRSGELELVSVPLDPGRHTLLIRANNKKGLSTEQQFHIQR
jgi:hypothetical protein